MKQFKVTIMIPQERMLEAPDIQDAHNQITAMMKNHLDAAVVDNEPRPKVHSIVELESPTVLDFGPSPAE